MTTTDPYAAENDPLYQAAHAYLSAKSCTLWSDFDISCPDRRRTAALWLTAQLRGVAEHYTAPTPFADYSGPYTAEAGGGGQRPDKAEGCKYGYTRVDCATAVPRYLHHNCYFSEALRRTDGPV